MVVFVDEMSFEVRYEEDIGDVKDVEEDIEDDVDDDIRV